MSARCDVLEMHFSFRVFSGRFGWAQVKLPIVMPFCRSFGFAAASSARAASRHSYSRDSDSSAAVSDDVEEINPGTLPPNGTKVKIRDGRYEGRSGTIIGHSGIGWFTVKLNWVRQDVKVRKHEFRVVQKE